MLALGEPWIRRALRDHLRSPRVIVWGIALAATAALLAAVPVFGVVGFGFAIAMALPASLAGADLGRALVRAARRRRPSAPDRAVNPGRLIAALWLAASLVVLALLLPPLVIATLNGLRAPTCEWGFGLAAYALLPGLSAVIASGMGVACGLATRRRRLAAALPYLVILASAAWSLWRFYAAPPAFSFNPFIGYFPGNLYDEDIQLPAAFFWSRAFQASAIAAALAALAAACDVPTLAPARGRRRRPSGLRARPLAALTASLAVTGALGTSAGSLGFAVGKTDIKAVLSKTIETENFIIHYPGGGAIERDIEAIAADHEFRYAQVVSVLGAEADGAITSYYFQSAEQKHRLIGARNVHMAKPWRREIYLNHATFPHRVVRHEIAHVVAGAFGDPIFGVSARRVLGVPLFFNVGLIEGIAVAADWPDRFSGSLTPHQSVKAMIELGYAPEIEQVFSTRFLALSSARSYTLAGSVVRYLLDEYGADRLRVLYRTGGDFELAYGRSRDAVLAAYREEIDALALTGDELERVRERFRRPGLFERPCPHAIARRRARAYELAGRGEAGAAAELMRSVCRADPGEPRHRLALGRLLVRAGRDDEAAQTLRELAADDEHITAPLRAQALSGLGSMAARRGDVDEAAQRFADAAALPVPDDLRRNARAQKLAARGETAGARAARPYFWNDDPRAGRDRVASAGRAAEIALAAPDEGLGHYLLGINLRGRGAPKEATRALSRALDRGLPDPLLVRNAARELAAAAYLAGDREAVERAASILDAPDQPMIDRLYGRDWLERLAWRDGTR